MRNIPAIIYLVWALFMVGLGLHIYHKMTDRSNPNSFISNMDKLNETIDGNP